MFPSISKIGPLAKCFLGAILLHGLCYAIWGIYYSEFSDRFFTAYVDGSFSGGFTKPIFYNYGFFTALSHLMAVGYNVLPQFNWYGIFGEVFMLLTTTGVAWLVYAFAHAFSKQRWLILGFVVFLLPYWCYHVVLYRTTELAFLTCGIGILGLVFSYLPAVVKQVNRLKLARVFFTILLLFSVFIRLEPTLMCTAIFLPYGLWVVGSRSARIGLFKATLVVLPVYIGAYMLYLGAIGPAEKVFRDTRVYTHTIWDFGQDEKLYTLSSAADSVKLEASKAYFISDEEMLSADFYHRIGIIPLEKSLGSIDGYFIGFNYRVLKAIDVWHGLLLTQPTFFIAYALALVSALFLLGYYREGKKLASLMGLQLWFLVILFAVTVFMKMELRVMAPLVTLNLVSLTLLPVLLLPKGWQANKASTWLLAITSIALLVPFVLKASELNQSANNYKLSNKNIQAFKEELKQPQFKDRIIVFHSFAWQMLYGNLFDNNEFAQSTNFLAIDNGEMYMYPKFKQAMEACCGGHTIKHIVNYLLANKEQVVFVSDAARMDLMERYIETVYGIQFNTKPAFPQSILENPIGGLMMPEYADHLKFSYYVFD